jgi:hypothetical protein
MNMRAIVEPAVLSQLSKLREICAEFLRSHVPKPELSDARSIDNGGAVHVLIQAG